MSLRGTGSLQDLLGRNLFASKKTNKKRPRDNDDNGDQSPPKSKPGNSPVKAGHARCPVCNVQLSTNDLNAFNSHLDKCLAQTKSSRPAHQSTLLRFKPPAEGTTKTIKKNNTSSSSDVIIIDDDDDFNKPTPHQPNNPVQPSPSWPSDTPKSPQVLQKQQQQQATTPRKTPHPSQSTSPSKKSPHRKRAATPLSVQPPICFPCVIVGRKYRLQASTNALNALTPGQRVLIQAEVNNPRDANALLVVDGVTKEAIGHLPRVVAQHLGPLIRKGSVSAEAVVTDVPSNERQPASIELQITLLPAGLMSPERAGAAVHRAREAVTRMATSSVGGGNGEFSTNTGEHLRKNFLLIMDTVSKEDAHLLDKDFEHEFITRFKRMSAPCQCLFLRLWQRKGPLFRVEALSYVECSDIGAAVDELQLNDFATRLDPLVDEDDEELIQDDTNENSEQKLCAHWEEIADVLTVPELQAILLELQKMAGKAFSSAASLPRAQVLINLGKFASQKTSGDNINWHDRLCDLLLGASGPLVRLNENATTIGRRLQRLFFLNEGQSLGQYLATDLGGLRYPTYCVQRTRSVFHSREHLLEYELALSHASQFTDALEEGDLEAAGRAVNHAWVALDGSRHKLPLPGSSNDAQQNDQHHHNQPLYLRRFNAAWIYCMMATAGVSLLEKEKRYAEAVDKLHLLLGGWCCPTRRGEWWLRLSTDLEHMNRPVDALEVAESSLADEWLSRGDRLALQRKVLKLGKPPRRWKKPPWADAALWEPKEVRIIGRPIATIVGVKSRFFPLIDDDDGSEPHCQQCTVEELALQYYSTSDGGGWRGVHCEGGIWATIFGLLLWEVLFSPVDDVFRTPFQTAPLDLDTDAFYPTRQILIEACLEQIANGQAPSMIEATWKNHHGCMCRGVSWDRWELEELLIIAKCIGGTGLAAVCRLLCQDHQGWSGGMPDLFLWKPESLEAKLSEVKGPRDRLSDQQRAWMAALDQGGLAVEVLKVVEPTGNGGKKKNSKGKGSSKK